MQFKPANPLELMEMLQTAEGEGANEDAVAEAKARALTEFREALGAQQGETTPSQAAFAEARRVRLEGGVTLSRPGAKFSIPTEGRKPQKP